MKKEALRWCLLSPALADFINTAGIATMKRAVALVVIHSLGARFYAYASEYMLCIGY